MTAATTKAPIAWSAKVSPEFVAKVIDVCGKLGIPDPSHLMACMA